jgi:hypothetical protein
MSSESSKPTFPLVQLEIADYRLPEADGLYSITELWVVIRDSVQQASDALFSTDRSSAGYRSQYQQFRELYSRFTAVSRQNERATRALLGPDRDLSRRVEAAADSLRNWEDSVYIGLDSIVDALTAANPPVSAQTIDQVARLRLKSGRWWITTRLPHPSNPFLEYFWNKPVTISSWKSNYRLPLSTKDALIRWRH